MEGREENLSLGTSEEDKDDNRSELTNMNIDNQHEYNKHQNLQTYDPLRQPYSFFYLGITGQIVSGDLPNTDGISLKFEFITGGKWKLVEGKSSGISQYGFKSQGYNKKIVWNYPFDLIYASTNVKEWPQIVIYWIGKDYARRNVIEAYGWVHVPTQPGKHTKYVRMFTPISSNIFSKFFGWVTGAKVEYKDAPKLLAKGEGREITRVQSGGLIKVSFQITQRNIERYGYITTSAKTADTMR